MKAFYSINFDFKPRFATIYRFKHFTIITYNKTNIIIDKNYIIK